MKAYLTKVLKVTFGITLVLYLAYAIFWPFAIAIIDNHWLWLYYIPLPFIIAGKDNLEKWFGKN